MYLPLHNILLAALIFLNIANSSELDDLARDTSRVESIRSIKNVQKQICHLLQFGQWREVGQLFSLNSIFKWGNETVRGAPSIEAWLRSDSRDMNGVHPGSLNTLITETPVISLSVDGRSAKGLWNGIWFQGDGKGESRIRGGVYENEYELMDDGWRISLLRYYAMYDGNYENGWRNVGGRGIPFIPFHFTAESSGVPIPPQAGQSPVYHGTIEELEARIQRLNDEDAVRNLIHTHGFYVDRRMWSDVVDLHTENTTVQITNGSMYVGKAGVRKALERMGPEGLTQGINNDHPIFDLIVDVARDKKTAVARGIEIAMLGDANTHGASWEFNVFRNQLIKEDGLWKVQKVVITPLIVADYYKGWAHGGLKLPNAYVPPFLNISAAPATIRYPSDAIRNVSIADLRRRLRRSAAFDGAENQSHAYGYYADDILAAELGGLFASKGHKANPFAGFFQTPERISKAIVASYGTNRSSLRSSLSFHWRPQPVILVSNDGRSASLRARLLQPSTSVSKAGSFNNAIYQDQVVLEDGKWRLWSVTIDEFYWSSNSWAEGWANPKPRNASAPNPEPAGWIKQFPPDLTLAEVGERESTFRGGSGRYIEWPEIQHMWFPFRNPVSGRVPEYYWPGCVPCQVRKDWSLEANGYQEPETGPVRAFG